MPVLYTILGIILFLIILLSFRLTVIIDYSEYAVVTLKYLFLKIPIIDPNKPEKKKKEKKEKPKEEEKEEEKPAEEKQKGGGLFKQIYADHGYDGIVKMLRETGRSLNSFFGKLYKTFTIDEMYLNLIVAGADAADTATLYGKLTAWLYPTLGKLISTCKVKKYDFDVRPDFLAKKPEGSAYVRLHVTPIVITNAAVVLVFQLLFKVLFKILFSKSKASKTTAGNGNVNNNSAAAGKKAKADEENNINNKTNINKDGASK